MNYVLDTKFKFTIMNIHGHAQAEDRLQLTLRNCVPLLACYAHYFFCFLDWDWCCRDVSALVSSFLLCSWSTCTLPAERAVRM